MSLQFDNINDYGQMTTAAAASLGNSYNITFFLWYKLDDSTADRQIMSIAASTETPFFLVKSATSVAWKWNGSDRGTWTGLTAGAWYGFSLQFEGAGVATGRLFGLDGTEIAVSSGSNTQGTLSAIKPNNLKIGNTTYGDSATGYYRYARQWKEILTAGQLASEAALGATSSGTPAARTTNLVHSWGLPDGTDTTDWAASPPDSLTLNSGSTGSAEPTFGGGGGPTVANDSALAGNRSRPGRGPYSIGRYYRRTRWLESDSPLASGSWSVAIEETGTAADAVSATLTAAATLAESASAADSMASALAAVAALAETAAASDSLASSLAAVAAIGEAASAVDSVAAVLAAVAALSDSGAASDSVSAIASLVAALAESVTASDSVNWGGGSSYSADIAEAASATDSLSAALAALATLAESGNATDTQSALASLLAGVAEAGAALDVLTVAGVYNVTVTETGTASDTLSADGNLLPAPQSRTVSIQMASRTITVTATNRTIH